MFGTPGSNIKTLKNDINYIKKIKPPHISIYSLDIEEETPLHKLIRRRKNRTAIKYRYIKTV